MKLATVSSSFLALSLLGLAACGISRPAEPAPVPEPPVVPETPMESAEAPPADPGIDLEDPHLSYAAPVRVKNLTIWPITSSAPALDRPEFLTLDEGLESGEVEVIETGTVSELQIVNRSKRPVLLLAGEILKGGKQDRIVAQDMTVGPGETTPLGSFCVEQGRWHASDGTGKFKSGKNFASNAMRESAQVEISQGAVWADTAFTNSANGLVSGTGAFFVNFEDPELQARVDERFEVVMAQLEKTSGIVGLVTAVDWGDEDEDVVAEVFGDAALFDRYREKLVRAYCLDAVTRANFDRLVAEGQFDASAGAGGGQLRLGQNDIAQQEINFFSSSLDLGGQVLSNDPATGAVPENPGVREVEGGIEAGNEDLKHLHRTIYKR